MRARISVLLAAVMLAGCSSGTHTVYVIRDRPVPIPPPAVVPTPPPAQTPPPVVVQPLEIALGRPSARAVPVQTNRAAYVAIFEITPKEGVLLVHPSTAKQARMVLSGLSSVPVWWESQPGAGRPGAPRSARPTRYIYALASERPLRLLDSAFVPGYLERVLGPSSFRAAAPQPAMRALARHFAPTAMSGKWAEDLYTLAPLTETSPRRVARIYCTGGTVYEVPEDIADRAWCPVQNTAGTSPTQPPAAAPARPDSVVGHNGKLVNRRMGDVVGLAVGHRDRDQGPGNSDKDKADKDKADKDKADKDKADKDKADKDKAAAEKADGDRSQKDKSDKEKRDQQQAEAERAARERVANERAANDRAANERAEKERVESERVEKEKAEKERSDKAAREKGEREKADKEKADREAADNAVAARERAETEHARVEKEKAEKEKADKAKADSDKADSDKAEKEKADKAKADSDKAEKEKADKAKADSDKAEKEKADKAKSDSDKAEKEKADKAKSDSDKAEKEKADKAKSDDEKSEKDKAEKEKTEKDKPAKPPKAAPPMR